MSRSVLFSAEAESDLAGIADVIAQDTPRRALTFVDELRAFVTNKLSTFPAWGPEIGRHRSVVSGSHVIPYRIEEVASTVRGQVIVEGHRNWRAAFGSST